MGAAEHSIRQAIRYWKALGPEPEWPAAGLRRRLRDRFGGGGGGLTPVSQGIRKNTPLQEQSRYAEPPLEKSWRLKNVMAKRIQSESRKDRHKKSSGKNKQITN